MQIKSQRANRKLFAAQRIVCRRQIYETYSIVNFRKKVGQSLHEQTLILQPQELFRNNTMSKTLGESYHGEVVIL